MITYCGTASGEAEQRRMRLVLVTPPAVEPLTTDEVRARQNIGSNVSDEVLQAYITAARQRIDGADGWLGRALNTQTWQAKFNTFPSDRIYLPLPPLQSVDISYLDVNGDPVTLVEDELLLSLPYAPTHAEGECAAPE